MLFSTTPSFAQLLLRNINCVSQSEDLFFYQGAVEQTGSASVSTAQCAFLWFAIVAATVFTVSSLLAAFQTASLFFFFLEAHIHAASRGRHTASLCFVQVYRCKSRGATVCFDVFFFCVAVLMYAFVKHET